MDISIGKLQQLVTVVRTGSFSKAAIELNISQPALSRSIAAIEERYGFQIFNRMGHGVQLTAAGAQVIELAQPLLQSMRVFDNNLRLFGSGKAGTLTIGMAPLLASQVLAQFAADYFNAASEAHLQVMIRPGADLLDSLKNDAIEMGFIPEGYIDPDPEIEFKPVGRIIPVCVVRNAHPLAGQDNLSLDDLARYPWAGSVAPPTVIKVLNPPQFICDNYHILLDAVINSDLICICSQAFVERQLDDETLRAIQSNGLTIPPTTIYSAKLRGRVISPLAEEAVKRMRDQLS